MILEIWPHPGGEAADVPLAQAEHEPIAADADGLQSSVSKYRPLTEWLQAQTSDELPMSFDDLEDILGFHLPASARNHSPYWYSASNSLGKAIAAAGFKSTGVNLTAERAVLARR